MDQSSKSETSIEVAQATAVFMKHEQLIRMLALSMSPLSDLVDDVVQEVFLELITKADRWDLSEPDKARNLVAVITRQVSARLWTKRRKDLPSTLAKVADQLTRQTETPDELTCPENVQRLTACIDLLPDRLRTIIRGYYYEGKSSRLLAEQLGISEDLVRRNLSRGREKLRELVKCNDEPTQE